MKKLNLIALYLLGFALFFIFMEILKAGDFIENLLNKLVNNDKFVYKTEKEEITFLNSEEDSNFNEKANDSTNKEIGTALHPEGSKNPLKLTKEELGRHSWALLHSIAASIPTSPSKEQRNKLEEFLELFAELYPCKICSSHFKEILKENPIRHSSREDFVYYLCELHNNVNRKLGKPIHDCKSAFEVWGGDCGCEVESK